jgi:pilus assembly protein CpaC
MAITRLHATSCRIAFFSMLFLAASISARVTGQTVGRQPLHFKVSAPVERLEMIVNTSRIINCDYNIPELMIDNENIVRAKPIATNQVQLSAIKPGFTTLTLFDDQKQEHAIDVLVYGDARELENLLMTEFPEASLRVRPLATSVVITGYVPRAELVSRIIRMAEDYYPNVINNITVGGVQTILLHCKLMEVSRTKLRRLGFDFAYFNGNDSVISRVSGLIGGFSMVPGAQAVASTGGETFAFGIVNDASSFFGFVDALKQNNLVKVLAEPTLVAVNGRPASFNSGGEFPILVPQSLGTISIQYRQFGTRVDFVPIALGNGRVRLEVRPQVSEIDLSRSVVINNTTVPGLRTRWVDTAVEMNAGQTLALAGLIQTQVEAEVRGLPVLADLPWLGAAFRRVREQVNEVELLVLVTPEFVDALDPQDVPPCGPGELTTSPTDGELYMRGYLEVPNECNWNCRVGLYEGGMELPAGAAHAAPQGPPVPLPVILPDVPQTMRPPVPSAEAPPSSSPDARPTVKAPVPVSPASAPRPALIGPVGYDANN